LRRSRARRRHACGPSAARSNRSTEMQRTSSPKISVPASAPPAWAPPDRGVYSRRISRRNIGQHGDGTRPLWETPVYVAGNRPTPDSRQG
jgi:hypothetical protein